MSKNHRGSGIRSLANHGRGVCGICGKADIKVLYEHEVNGQATNICKFCKAALKNKARIEARKAVKEMVKDKMINVFCCAGHAK